MLQTPESSVTAGRFNKTKESDRRPFSPSRVQNHFSTGSGDRWTGHGDTSHTLVTQKAVGDNDEQNLWITINGYVTMLIREAVWFKLLFMFPLKNISALVQLGEAVAATEDTEQDVL